MIENYRTGLLWKIFMNIPEVQDGMKKLGFSSPYFTQTLGARIPKNECPLSAESTCAWANRQALTQPGKAASASRRCCGRYSRTGRVGHCCSATRNHRTRGIAQ